MLAGDAISALIPVIEALEELEIPYQIGGSVASSVHGFARSTLDADLVVDLKAGQILPLVNRLQNAYYLSIPAIEEAVQHRRSFNLIHLDTIFKIDIFVLKTENFDRVSFGRVSRAALSQEDPRQYNFTSPEDIVLRKLEWYKTGGGVSERQWLDLIGVLKVQAQALDFAYLKEWADRLMLTELLEQALNETDLKSI